MVKRMVCLRTFTRIWWTMLNEEQMLEVCLIAYDHEPELFEGYVGEFITWYALKQCKPDVSDEELRDKISEIVVGFTLRRLCEKGVVEATLEDDGSTSYSTTDGEEDEMVYG